MDSVFNQKQDTSVFEDRDSAGSEHSVDSIHQRFQSDTFTCIACRQAFEKKSKLKEHFKSGCGRICATCQSPMYLTLSPYGVENGHVCKKGVKQTKMHSNAQSQHLNNSGSS